MTEPVIVRANSLALPIAPGTVSLMVTSPPYWALRAYEDGGEFYDGQLGSEPTPEEFLRGLWAVADQTWGALRDDGVAWWNLGDKYAGSGGHNNSGVARNTNGTGASTRGHKGEGGGPYSERLSSKGGPSQLQGRSQRASDPATRANVSRAANFPSSDGQHGARERPGKAKSERNGFRSAAAADARDRARDQQGAPVASRASRARVPSTRRNAPDRYEQGTEWARAKSLMALPWAFVLGCLNPTLYRDHIDPPWVACDNCDHGTDPSTLTTCNECDGLGEVYAGPHPQWVYRAEQIWSKPNGLPESVDDRPRRSHEVWLMLAKNGRHYGSTDELREPYNPNAHDPGQKAWGDDTYPTWGAAGSQSVTYEQGTRTPPHPLGKPPGSVWTISAEPFVDELFHLDPEGGRVLEASELVGLNRWRLHHDLPPYTVPASNRADGLWKHRVLNVYISDTPDCREAEHFAPFPTEWPRRLVLGWSPSAICTVCGEGRRPVVTKAATGRSEDSANWSEKREPLSGWGDREFQRDVGAVILGYVCSCCPVTDHGPKGDNNEHSRDGTRSRSSIDLNGDDFYEAQAAKVPRYEYHLDQWTAPPTRPAIVVDVFGGTGTTAMVAAALGRVGVSVDLSWDYCQLAKWRTASAKGRAKTRSRTNARRQGNLFGATDNQGATP